MKDAYQFTGGEYDGQDQFRIDRTTGGHNRNGREPLMLRLRLSGSAAALALTFTLFYFALPVAAKDLTLFNASYDPTRELYHEFNDVFAKHWKDTTGDSLMVRQSNGGSGAQARAAQPSRFRRARSATFSSRGKTKR